MVGENCENCQRMMKDEGFLEFLEFTTIMWDRYNSRIVN
jgi:hypothetical protein